MLSRDWCLVNRQSHVIRPVSLMTIDSNPNTACTHNNYSTSFGDQVEMCSLSNQEIESTLKSWNPRKATVTRIRQAFSKMKEVLEENADFPPSNRLSYVQAIFANDAVKSKQIWWIENCATCGAPDDIYKGSEIHLFLEKTTKVAIVDWLKNWFCIPKTWTSQTLIISGWLTVMHGWWYYYDLCWCQRRLFKLRPTSCCSSS